MRQRGAFLLRLGISSRFSRRIAETRLTVVDALRAVKAVCGKYGALLILDEVMSGMGRAYTHLHPHLCFSSQYSPIGMGTTHAWESFGDGVHPDIETCAKGLGGG